MYNKMLSTPPLKIKESLSNGSNKIGSSFMCDFSVHCENWNKVKVQFSLCLVKPNAMKTYGGVKIKQKPVTMGDRTLSLERTPLQNGINTKLPLAKGAQKKMNQLRTSYTIVRPWLNISSPGPLLYGARCLPRRPCKKDTALHSKCRTVAGLK
jgi:hypothetical protein